MFPFSFRADKDFNQMYMAESNSKAQLKENLRLQKEIIDNIRFEPWHIKRKLKALRWGLNKNQFRILS